MKALTYLQLLENIQADAQPDSVKYMSVIYNWNGNAYKDEDGKYLSEKVLLDHTEYGLVHLKIIEFYKPVLDEIEKEYINNFIKPFKYSVCGIRRLESGKYSQLQITYLNKFTNSTCEIYLPTFETGNMYKNMEANVLYKRQELDLNEH